MVQRLVEAFNFEADEALLTGESLPVHKDADAIFDEETGPGDRLNIAYSSSTVTRGRARGVVVGTGMVTEIGAIAVALRGGDSKVRPVKRGPQGETKKRWYLQAWALTTTDAVGRFLGVNVGTPLQRKLSKLALVLFAIAVIFAIVVMGANKMRGDKEVIIYAVATGLAMIPACLVVVLTITMAGGTKQMAQRNVIVRKLDSLEALGAVTNICSDKTGTLTQGRMVAKRAWIPSLGTYSIGPSSNPLDPHEGDVSLVPDVPVNIGDQSDENPSKPEDLVQDNPILKDFLNIASMANLAHVHKTAHGEWQARGEPTDIAIQVLASRFQWNRERWTKGEKPVWRQKAEYPFDSTVKKMSVIFAKDEGRDKGKEMIFTKGAVERVLQSCTSVKWIGDSGIIPLDAKVQSGILQNMEALAKLGLRVLALASREHRPGPVSEEKLPREDVEKDLTLCGLIGIYDPPRPETAGAIEQCRRAGITAHMVTGDHPGTARAIAAQVGIIPSSTEGLAADVAEAMVMTASQFDRLTDEEIDKLPQLPAVIARCAPNTKVRMIEALHRRGRYAAMTGDGVNDSPSLKRADVGIAMGQAGSDVAKDASELVLMDDNFASIINGIEEGRRIFDNIQKFVLHLLAENVALALTLLIGLAFKDETGQSVFPIAPVEILWIIMITSGLPDMGLGREAAAADVMDRPPQSVRHPTLSTSRSKLTRPETRNFHLGSNNRYVCVRGVDGGAVSRGIFPGALWVGRREPFPRVQYLLPTRCGWAGIQLRHGVPGAGNDVHVHDVVRTISGLGADRYATQLFPNAARVEAVPDAVDVGRLEKQVPVLWDHGRLRDHLPDPVHPEAERRGLQAYGDLVGMGDCIRGGAAVLPRG